MLPRGCSHRASLLIGQPWSSGSFAQIVLRLFAGDALEQALHLAALRGLSVGPVADHLLLGAHMADKAVDRFGKVRHRSEEHTSELQSLTNLVCRLLLEKKNC